MFKRLKKLCKLEKLASSSFFFSFFLIDGKVFILIAYVAGNRILRLQHFCSKQKKDHQGYLMGSMMAEVMEKT
jgi:hypothetical protein